MSGIFDPPDLRQADTLDLIEELRRRRPIPVGCLRNGQWFASSMARNAAEDVQHKQSIGVKLSGSVESGFAKVAWLPGHHTCGVGPIQISPMSMVYPCSNPQGKTEPQAPTQMASEGVPLDDAPTPPKPPTTPEALVRALKVSSDVEDKIVSILVSSATPLSRKQISIQLQESGVKTKDGRITNESVTYATLVASGKVEEVQVSGKTFYKSKKSV